MQGRRQTSKNINVFTKIQVFFLTAKMHLANLRENKKTNAIKTFILLTSSMGLLYMLKNIFKYIWTELKISIIL